MLRSSYNNQKLKFAIKGICCVLFILLCALNTAVFAEEAISLFGTELLVHKEGHVIVTQTIKIKAEGKKLKRGIAIQLLKSRTIDDKEKPLNYNFILSQRNGAQQDFSLLRFKDTALVMLSKNREALPPGEHTYLLQFKVKGAIDFLETYDRLTWYVTGFNFQVPIKSSVVVIRLPKSIARGSVLPTLKASYTGTKEDRHKHYKYAVQKDGSIKFWTTRVLEPREGFVVNVGWPKGYVREAL